ncbi:putative Acriflavin resistance protein [Acetoanaerobium sticklandii]|uniref:Putative Acriflavin resistance protein n=1 Tax=Acetoanaerobium sticklandii (strain ATCC 12662 / DSM 519 / JCM 1433 / CCUG 9281 / NCIMB 10654 / HF) TaxID=499177 RepID=E3PWN2_ACESD|nr:efflux RND transporter permease subunit [Acetoanaerobium sticklandii]CBH20847.1 putative Acriflavin resistance protein [Acetoanaerobium sticklandii]
MKIGQISIKYKYFILSLTIAILLFGTYSKMTLKSQMSPDTNSPSVTVLAQYPGASAQDVINDVIEPIENVFGSLDGIKNIKSIGQDNVAIIKLDFNYGINVDQAAIDVQNSLSRIKSELPANLPEAKVLKFSTSDKPVATISLSSDSVDLREIRQIAEEKIAFDLQLIDGVASVSYFGGNETQVEIQLDRSRMNAHGITINQINSSLLMNNIKAPGGKITDDGKEVLVRIEDEFKNLEDIKNLGIKTIDGNKVYLSDLGEVYFNTGDKESAYVYNGSDGIALMITKKSDANTIDVIDNLKENITDLEKKYPFINFEIAQDDSIFTNQMINNMTISVLTALLFTMLIIVLFIKNINQSLVISASMPLVFMSTLGLMKLSGMKLDMVTLSALILSIGFVVDGAIVVVENIMTHYNKSKNIIQAAIDGTNEIAMPSIAGATTTLIVLIPLLFIKGFVGEMFRPLAMTVIFAITSSIVIALIVIPLFTVMFHKFSFKKIEKAIGYISEPFNKMMDKILEIYIILLKKSLSNKLKMLLIIVVLMGLSGSFIASNGIEMLPKFDGGTTFLSIELEPGTKVEETLTVVDDIESFLELEKNIESYDVQVGYEKNSAMIGDFGIMGTNQALFTINLLPRTDRKETIWSFQERLRFELKKIPDIERFVVKEKGGTATSSSTAPLDIRISGDDEEVIYKLASNFEEEVKKIQGTTNIYKSVNMDNDQILIKTNEEELRRLGLSTAEVSKQIYIALEGINSTTINTVDANNIDVKLIFKEQYRNDMDALKDINITSPIGAIVPLREIAEFESGKRSNMITKENLENTIDIYGYIDSRAYSHVTSDIQKLIDKYPVPTDYSIKLSGESSDMGESMKDMLFLLILAIIFVYLILVPQFKSFIHPITIMASIPLVIIGIAPALGLTNKYVSMPVLLGFILLAGTVVNNAILVIDQTILAKKTGLSTNEALISAITVRYRPIMMTALSDVVGMLPLAMQLALGSERFSPLAVTIIGGILSATFLTLIVIPVLFAGFEEIKEKFVE